MALPREVAEDSKRPRCRVRFTGDRPSLAVTMDTSPFLQRRFREARLDLELLREPIARGRATSGVNDIVQIDIARQGKSELFRLYPGTRDNRIEVLGTDATHRQLVLFVEEARRRFEVRVARHVALLPGTRIVSEEKHARVIEQFTEASKRHFLCGMDEQHLFIAELPHGASSVHGAREALRAPEVPPSFADRRHGIVRQGEWFFLPIKARERAGVDEAVRKGTILRNVGIAQGARLNRAGRPHVADELVVLPARPLPLIFVRGEVHHPDHRTVTFREFRRTVPNRERFAQPAGVLWVD